MSMSRSANNAPLVTIKPPDKITPVYSRHFLYHRINFYECLRGLNFLHSFSHKTDPTEEIVETRHVKGRVIKCQEDMDETVKEKCSVRIKSKVINLNKLVLTHMKIFLLNEVKHTFF